MGIRPISSFPRECGQAQIRAEISSQRFLPLSVELIADVERFQSSKGKKCLCEKLAKFSVCLSSQMIQSGWYDAWSLHHQISFHQCRRRNVHIYLSSEYSHFNTYYKPTSFPIQVNGARAHVSPFSVQNIPANVLEQARTCNIFLKEGIYEIS